MKKYIIALFFSFVSVIFLPAGLQAQHFISIQSADKQPFFIRVNGINFNSAQNGSLRISNLSAGTYNLVISFAANKYPAQNFTCALNKTDESYSLKNLGQKGWVLKNLNSAQLIAAASADKPEDEEGRMRKRSVAFGQMLAEVADDSELLKPTVWVYSDKPDAPATDSVNVQQTEQDNAGYISSTKGVIKAVEQEVKGGTEMVFVDFSATGGDTIHLIIPSTDVAFNKADSSSIVETHIAATDSAAVNKPTTINEVASNNNQEENFTEGKKRAKKEAQTPAFDTSANRQFSNPFFKKDTAAGNAAEALKDTTANQQSQAATIITPADPAMQKPAGDTAASSLPLTKAGCEKMLTDNAAEKLKHRIYLETDEGKMIDIAKKYLDGKCITTEQVKNLAGFFSSDDSRLSFFRAVYPFVYDYGNFGALESYMIDKNYKENFRAILK